MDRSKDNDPAKQAAEARVAKVEAATVAEFVKSTLRSQLGSRFANKDMLAKVFTEVGKRFQEKPEDLWHMGTQPYTERQLIIVAGLMGLSVVQLSQLAQLAEKENAAVFSKYDPKKPPVTLRDVLEFTGDLLDKLGETSYAAKNKQSPAPPQVATSGNQALFVTMAHLKPKEEGEATEVTPVENESAESKLKARIAARKAAEAAAAEEAAKAPTPVTEEAKPEPAEVESTPPEPKEIEVSPAEEKVKPKPAVKTPRPARQKKEPPPKAEKTVRAETEEPVAPVTVIPAVVIQEPEALSPPPADAAPAAAIPQADEPLTPSETVQQPVIQETQEPAEKRKRGRPPLPPELRKTPAPKPPKPPKERPAKDESPKEKKERSSGAISPLEYYIGSKLHPQIGTECRFESIDAFALTATQLARRYNEPPDAFIDSKKKEWTPRQLSLMGALLALTPIELSHLCTLGEEHAPPRERESLGKPVDFQAATRIIEETRKRANATFAAEQRKPAPPVQPKPVPPPIVKPVSAPPAEIQVAEPVLPPVFSIAEPVIPPVPPVAEPVNLPTILPVDEPMNLPTILPVDEFMNLPTILPVDKLANLPVVPLTAIVKLAKPAARETLVPIVKAPPAVKKAPVAKTDHTPALTFPENKKGMELLAYAREKGLTFGGLLEEMRTLSGSPSQNQFAQFLGMDRTQYAKFIADEAKGGALLPLMNQLIERFSPLNEEQKVVCSDEDKAQWRKFILKIPPEINQERVNQALEPGHANAVDMESRTEGHMLALAKFFKTLIQRHGLMERTQLARAIVQSAGLDSAVAVQLQRAMDNIAGSQDNAEKNINQLSEAEISSARNRPKVMIQPLARLIADFAYPADTVKQERCMEFLTSEKYKVSAEELKPIRQRAIGEALKAIGKSPRNITP